MPTSGRLTFVALKGKSIEFDATTVKGRQNVEQRVDVVVIYTYICIYVYMYICIYVYMYICIYVYTTREWATKIGNFYCPYEESNPSGIIRESLTMLLHYRDAIE